MALSKVDPNFVSQTPYGRRNLIINGAMQVAQRGTSTTDSNGFGVDRFHGSVINLDQLVTTYSQSSTAPAGFTSSLKVNVDTAETALAADEYLRVYQRIEAQDLQHLQYGSSGAKSLTLSFWVRSNVTGKYSVFIYQSDGVRSNTQSYTINSADTWEYKTITIDGDTAGTINNDNGEGLAINFILAAGSDRAGTPHTGWGAFTATDDFSHSDMVQTFITTANNNWYITGVQLEVGDTATPFEHRSYGEEFALCKRYFQQVSDVQASGFNYNDHPLATYYLPVEMRATPTATEVLRGNAFSSTNATGQTSYSGPTTSAFNTGVTFLRIQITGGSWTGSGNDRGNALFVASFTTNLDAEL
jgi:hypothetical protein